MRRGHFALVVPWVLVALVLPLPASAKESGPVRIVAESGKVGWLRGESARAWWAELDSARSGACVCNSPDAAARFAGRLMRRARWPSHVDGGWPTGVLLIQSGHSGPWLYYPASRTTPPFLAGPAGLGSRQLSWDDWRLVTPRMQRLIARALAVAAGGRGHGNASTFPTGPAVAGIVGAALLASLLLVMRRRPRKAVFG